jgi:hypothetical protein
MIREVDPSHPAKNRASVHGDHNLETPRTPVNRPAFSWTRSVFDRVNHPATIR